MSSRRTWWGTAAGLGLGLLCAAGGTCRADDDDPPKRSSSSVSKPRSPGLIGRLFETKEEDAPVKVTKVTSSKSGAERTTANKPAIPRFTNKGDVVGQLAKERDTYLRRMQVCDRLREIAAETGDPTLEKQAELLEDRARTIYQQRSARLLANDADMASSKAEEKLLEPAMPKLPRNDTAQIHTIRGSGTSTSDERKE